MVDSTSTLNQITQDIIADENRIRINRAKDMWMSNIKALIKLRQKGATKVSNLPKDVFRCILEYQFPNELCWRYSEPNEPIKDEQDRHFPAIENLNYENYLVAINWISDFEY